MPARLWRELAAFCEPVCLPEGRAGAERVTQPKAQNQYALHAVSLSVERGNDSLRRRLEHAAHAFVV